MRRTRKLNERQDEKLSMKNIRNKNQALTREQPSYTDKVSQPAQKSESEWSGGKKKIGTIIWGKQLKSTEMT